MTQFLLIISIKHLPELKIKSQHIDENSLLSQVPTPVFNEQNFKSIKIAKFVSDTDISDNHTKESAESNVIEFKEWYPSTYLPFRIDNEFRKLYHRRSYFYTVQYSANSTFELGIDLNSFEKLVKYLPRAIQIGLFSPFPSSWFAEHPSHLSKLMHFVTGIEMLFIYICLVGFVISLFIWKKKIEFWMYVCFSFYFILIPIYAIPNIGALIRYRYGAIMLLVALGISAYLKFYISKKKTIQNDYN